MPKYFTDDQGVDWIRVEDVPQTDKYADKEYKLIAVPFWIGNEQVDGMTVIRQLEKEVNDYMENANEFYLPSGPPFVANSCLVQLLVDEDVINR